MQPLYISYGERDSSEYSDVEMYTQYLIVNGEHAYDSRVSCITVTANEHVKEHHKVVLQNGHIKDLITSYPFNQLPSTWQMLTLPLEQSWSKYLTSLSVDLKDIWNLSTLARHGLVIYFYFDIDWASWIEPWTINDYARKLEQIVNNKNVEGLNYVAGQFEDRLMSSGIGHLMVFGIICDIRSVKSVISQEAKYWSEIVHEIVIETENALTTQVVTDAFVTRFSFPSNIKTACEQYLLYFVQFLSDLGIEAKANLNNQAPDVLFSVTPKNKDQALSTIQDALTAYLSIPSSSTFAADVALSNDIAVKQLEANVYHLKGQVMLAQALLQAKDATIDALQLTNFQQRQLLEVSKLKEDVQSQNESVMDGIVQITPYEGKGFIVDLPKLIRRLKRSFLR